MSDQPAIPDWHSLYRRLTMDLPANYGAYHPGSDVVLAAAAQFEAASSFTLPNSYKAFAQVFGPGELGAYYRVHIPGDAKCRSDLATTHFAMQAFFEKYPFREQGRLAARLITFADTIGGESVGWDPFDVTDQDGPEYRIYYVLRSCKAQPVAATFLEFVEEIGLKYRLHEFFGWQNNNPPDWPPQTFQPYR